MSTTVALSAWKDQVSTTCDFAERLVVAEIEQGRELSRQEIMLHEESAARRARRIEQLNVEVLICGAISKPLAEALTLKGIELIPYISGPVDDVLGAYLCGQLTRPRFLQPGCRSGARRRWRHNMRRMAHQQGGQSDAR
jgi:predicted Fe-Mo cluster-binding NifX family protein